MSASSWTVLYTCTCQVLKLLSMRRSFAGSRNQLAVIVQHCADCEALAVTVATVKGACIHRSSVNKLKSSSTDQQRLRLQAALAEAIEDAGFTAQLLKPVAASTSDKIALRVHGMTCSSCSSAVEKCLQGLPGIKQATVNLLANKAEVQHQPQHLSRPVQCPFLPTAGPCSAPCLMYHAS